MPAWRTYANTGSASPRECGLVIQSLVRGRSRRRPWRTGRRSSKARSQPSTKKARLPFRAAFARPSHHGDRPCVFPDNHSGDDQPVVPVTNQLTDAGQTPPSAVIGSPTFWGKQSGQRIPAESPVPPCADRVVRTPGGDFVRLACGTDTPALFLWFSLRALPPAFEPHTNVPRVQPQHRTDIHKRERPVVVIGEKPLLGLSGQALNAPPAANRLFLKAPDR